MDFINVYCTLSNGLPVNQNTPAYQVDEPDANTTYIRYEPLTTAQWIKRITKVDTVTTIEKSFGLWTDRATLTYKAINA